MESRGETCELQQLVPSDVDGENEDSLAQDDYTLNGEKTVSPLRSMKISSTGTSHSSVSKRNNPSNTTGTANSKLFYINEKRFNKDSKSNTARPRNPHKVNSNGSTARHHCFLSEVPDVRHMEQALLGLLADFHSGKLKAFGSGTTMEQMKNIREQQEKLAKLHFDLSATSDPPLSDIGLKHSRNTMSQLIDRLEQLSVSIEGLHNNNKK
ncbi:coiled-coil domain-containing protein 28B isoform X1 [Agrilus planipennis]|uniref:Coiled-coil domain-containing protein 28B isoform X1 n=1 Tax=Agrilus planipennis TaxID=224129 RepID=A0A1W4WZ34_AGRPL|nr:coiled-coil domain-containing protein 28B isoform X1 [Agrilus planipennis]